MKFIKKFPHTNDDALADTEAIIELTEDVVISLEKTSMENSWGVPTAIAEKKDIKPIKLSENIPYEITLISNYDFVTNDEVDYVNESKTIEELIYRSKKICTILYFDVKK